MGDFLTPPPRPPCVPARCERSLVPWASFRGWPQSCPWAGTGSPGGWSGACGTPRSSPSPGAGANCHGQKAGHPFGREREREERGGDININKEARGCCKLWRWTGARDSPPAGRKGSPHSSTHLLSGRRISPPNTRQNAGEFPSDYFKKHKTTRPRWLTE